MFSLDYSRGAVNDSLESADIVNPYNSSGRSLKRVTLSMYHRGKKIISLKEGNRRDSPATTEFTC